MRVLSFLLLLVGASAFGMYLSRELLVTRVQALDLMGLLAFDVGLGASHISIWNRFIASPCDRRHTKIHLFYWWPCLSVKEEVVGRRPITVPVVAISLYFSKLVLTRFRSSFSQ